VVHDGVTSTEGAPVNVPGLVRWVVTRPVPRDPLAAFDPEIVSAVAEVTEGDVEALWSLVRRHQEAVRDLPGVTDLVYEWRRTLDETLVVRTEEAFCCAVRPVVWSEFAAALSLSAIERDRLEAVHDRQARRIERQEGVDASSFDGRAAVVLTRE
jgi:hypothetical protein